MRKILSYSHLSFSLENVKRSSNYKIIKSGRSLDLAYQLGAMTRRGLPHLNPLLARRGIVWIICCLFSFNAHATCTPAPDCASIGYTETSCETISLKCPFDQTKLYCFPCDSSFQYSCSNTNEYGNGESCKGKYKSCCNTDCIVGNYYYLDKTCSSCLDNAKTMIGIVVKDYELIMAQDIIISKWASSESTIANLPSITEKSSALADYSGQTNTSAIVAHYGNSVENVAGVYCYNYYPTAMENSKNSWYLPAQGEVYEYLYKNWEKLALSLEKLNKPIPNVYVWSSTVYSIHSAWTVMMNYGYVNPQGDNKYNYQLSTICLLKI